MPAPDNDVARFFDRHPLFADLSAGDLAHLARNAHTRRFSRRQVIWSPGEAASSVLIVRRGVVRISQITANERELTLDLYGRRGVLGEVALAPKAVRTDRAVAHEDVLLYSVHREHLLQLLDRNARVATGLLAQFSIRRARLDQRMAAVAYLTARARVASVLLELAATFGVQDSRGTIVDVRLTHREMAALIGATRETVSFAILAFRRAGLIETEHKRVVLLDVSALRREAEEAGEASNSR